MEMRLPEMRVVEEGDEVVVRIFVSGVSEQDIEFDVSEDSLRVSISREASAETDKEGYSSREWRSSSFGGEVSLPVRVVPMLVRHSYDGKVLEVRLKKAEV